jgi:hypothetical protein
MTNFGPTRASPWASIEHPFGLRSAEETMLYLRGARPLGIVYRADDAAVLPVLSGRVSLLSLLRLWGVVYVSKLVGAIIFARIITIIGSFITSFSEPWKSWPASFQGRGSPWPTSAGSSSGRRSGTSSGALFLFLSSSMGTLGLTRRLFPQEANERKVLFELDSHGRIDSWGIGHAFASHLSRVSESRPDVVDLQLRIGLEQFPYRHPLGEVFHDQRHPDPRASNARLAEAFPGIDRDPFEQFLAPNHGCPRFMKTRSFR